MTGTGTQADPYLVDNITDFRAASVMDNVYIKLTADLDCNKEGYLEWQTLTSRCKEVDFDGHALINPLIASNNYLVNSSITPLYKNGQILNIYENSANGALYSVALSNMSISAFLTKTVNRPFTNIAAEKCNFVINNQNLNNKAWFSANLNINGMTGFKDCRFKFNGNISTESLFISWNSNMSNLIANDCRFEGRVKADYGSASNPYLINGRITNSVVALNTLGSTSAGAIILANADNTNIYQSDISGLQNHGSAIPCTSEQILDPDYLNSVGFTVAEVIL